MGPQLRAAWGDASAYAMPDGPWAIPSRTVLEIGSGMGDALIAAASNWDLAIGIDVHIKGLAATVRAAQTAGLRNVRVVHGDATELLRDRVSPGSLEAIHIWFPDPWPKAKHHKRRLLRPEVSRLLASRLVMGGVVQVATDVEQYAQVIARVLRETPGLQPLGRGGIVERPGWRPVTRYERAGRAAGRTATELAFARAE